MKRVIKMNRRGFTLIELLATLAVLGIITGIVLVSSTSLFKDKKSDTEDVFVDTLKDAIKIYIDELGGVELNGDPVCTIEKSIHPNGVGIGIYEVKNEVKKITFEDITNYEDREKVGKLLEKELKELFKKNNIKDSDECLVIGLGNRLSTADSLGVKVLDHIVITRHLFLINANVKEGFRIVSGFTPSVLGQTGIETKDVIVSLINAVKPKFVIAIDSLASSSIDRINKTIQITDTGIHPGSGVGNNRKELSKKTLGIPVIAIGVPTVVSSSIIVNDTLNYLFKHLSYIKDNKETNKLIIKRNNRYKDKIKDRDLSQEEKNNLLGLVGSLDNDTKKRLMEEVLTSINANLIVTSTEIDFLIDKLSNLISSALNNSLHRQITHY